MANPTNTDEQAKTEGEKATPAPRNALGFVNFDGSSGDNSLVEVRVPRDRIERVRRGQYVLMGLEDQGTAYLGRVVQGPFYTPDAVGRDSSFARASILMGDKVKFLPDFHAVCSVEILGRVFLDSLALVGNSTRPLPKTFVWELQADHIEQLLNLNGNMYLGHLAGYEGVRVNFKSDEKKVLPRNLGIFGTVGSGKTNTSQVLIEEAAATGHYAVVVLDVEGEYVSMDKPSQELAISPKLRKVGAKFGISPKGLDALRVYHVTGTETKREDATEFCVKFGNISPYTLCEIMGLNEAQEHRFLELYDTAMQTVQTGRPSKGKSKWDRLKGGEAVVGLDRIPELTLQLLADKLKTDILPNTKGADRSSWLKINQILHKLKRYGIFDTQEQGIDVRELLAPGMVSVFDLSDSTNTRINNIVIADILRQVFDFKLEHEDAPPTLVMVEEAHTFVSRENVSKMEFTMEQLREISRRGRKRWLGLCFISQQPAHLPDELYELCNTKIIHQTTGRKNLDSLKTSAGNVNEAVWGEVPILGQGRCVIVSPQFSHPVLCDMRPCRTHREYTD